MTRFTKQLRLGYESTKGDKKQELEVWKSPQEVTTIKPQQEIDLLRPAEVEIAPEFSVAPSYFRFEAWCSKYGKPFVVVAERHGTTLLFVGNERCDRTATSGWPSGWEMFNIDAVDNWCCPWCQTREDPSVDFLRLLWSCDMDCGQVMHCCGSSSGKFLCACGQKVKRTFVRGETFWLTEYDGVRGPTARRVLGFTHGVRYDYYPQYRGISAGPLARRRK